MGQPSLSITVGETSFYQYALGHRLSHPREQHAAWHLNALLSGWVCLVSQGQRTHWKSRGFSSSRFSPSLPVVDKLHNWVALARLALPELRTPAKIAASSSFKATPLLPTILCPSLCQGSKRHPCKPSRHWQPWATEHFKNKSWVKISWQEPFIEVQGPSVPLSQCQF